MAQYVDQKLLSSSVNNVKGNVPAFLTKLWKIVEDPQYDSLISWNENGTSIKIHQPIAFSQELLPKFYKHNNFSSFVRQVNMYGFRKIVDVASGAKNSDGGDWEFYHTCFQRGHPENIASMKRKVQLKDDVKYNNSQFGNLLQDVEILKTQHDMVDEKLKQTSTENKRLWGEVFDLRERHASQQAMIVKLLQFFLQIVMSKSERNPRKRRYTAQEDLPENVFFQKRALHLPDGKNKTMVIQYDSPSIAEISGSVDPSLITTQGEASISPVLVAQDRVAEVPILSQECNTEPLQDNTIKDENGIPPCMMFNTTPKSMPHSLGEVPTKSTKEKPQEKQLPTSPFIFPEVYKQAPEVPDTIDLSACISTEEGDVPHPIVYPAKSATLSTPDVTTVIKKNPKDSQQLSTPIVTMPTVLTRQTSFRDRDEVSTNVDNISKSIDMLQDMLSKQEINLDLKTLGTLGDTPSTVSMQELIKLIHQQTDDEEDEDDTNIDIETVSPHEENPIIQDKVVPYSSCFSPSHLMDPDFETVNAEDVDNTSSFFSSVLQNECDVRRNHCT